MHVAAAFDGVDASCAVEAFWAGWAIGSLSRVSFHGCRISTGCGSLGGHGPSGFDVPGSRRATFCATGGRAYTHSSGWNIEHQDYGEPSLPR
jgi:hypothetical protein